MTSKRAVKAASLQSEETLAQHVLEACKQHDPAPRLQNATIWLAHQGKSYSCRVCKASTVDKTERKDVMDLLEENMRERYQASTMGWSRREKQEELFDKSSRFILLRNEKHNLAAFANWRFDCEECDERDDMARHDDGVVEVLYCYEVQVQRGHQGQRLGRVLMDALHSLAIHSRMRKVMLTVFLSNASARRFYHQLGYISDLISPSRRSTAEEEDDEDVCDYDILSKPVLTGASA